MEMELPLIWFWVVELVALVAPAVTVALSRGTLGRKGYTIRFTAAFLLSIVATAFAYEFLVLLLVSPLPLLALHILIVRWTSMRLNDLQSDRWYALLWYIPPVGLVLAILLTVKRHRKDPVLF